MPSARATWTWRRRLFRFPFDWPTRIFGATVVYLSTGLTGLILWQLGWDVAWVDRLLGAPGAVLLVLLAGIQLWLSVQVWGHYQPGEPMRTTWLTIGLSAAADLAGVVLVQGLRFRPQLVYLGHFFASTLRYTLLAAGLFAALRVYRKAQFLGKLKPIDIQVLAVLGAFVAAEIWSVVKTITEGSRVTAWQIFGWPADPLLLLLLGEAMLLNRCVLRMGPGWIGRCWYAFSAGILLTAAGNISELATAYGIVRYPWSSIFWFVWIPAACAFALAPAFQLEAIERTAVPSVSANAPA